MFIKSFIKYLYKNQMHQNIKHFDFISKIYDMKYLFIQRSAIKYCFYWAYIYNKLNLPTINYIETIINYKKILNETKTEHIISKI